MIAINDALSMTCMASMICIRLRSELCRTPIGIVASRSLNKAIAALLQSYSLVNFFTSW